MTDEAEGEIRRFSLPLAQRESKDEASECVRKWEIDDSKELGASLRHQSPRFEVQYPLDDEPALHSHQSKNLAIVRGCESIERFNNIKT